MKTQVAIIGSGPSGLLLGHLLRRAGVDCVIIEHRSRAHVEGRIRAGVLERVTTELMERLGLDARMNAEGLVHDGFRLVDDERSIRIDMSALTGAGVMVYGQTEVTRDLIDAAPDAGLEIIWEADDVSLCDVAGDAPFVTYRLNGEAKRIDAEFVAGCDGYHGPSRSCIPDDVGRPFELVYPFGWLGILADVPPCDEELIYAKHRRGFALASMRSKTRSRYYVQVPAGESVDEWPDDRLWDEIEARLDGHGKVTRGPAIEKSIAPLRSFVFEPMRHGRLFLAGDAAHIVPPTGAKGLNLAASDVIYLADALIAWFDKRDADALEAYSAKALARIWRSERFSWYLTRLTHRFDEQSAFEQRMQDAEFADVAQSEAMQRVIAESYVGPPL